MLRMKNMIRVLVKHGVVLLFTQGENMTPPQAEIIRFCDQNKTEGLS